jgi:hypothetical protein
MSEKKYRPIDVQKEFGICNKTMYNWISKGILRKPDIQSGNFTMWLGNPLAPNQSTSPSA